VGCDPLNYSGVDAAKWECAKDVVRREYGIDIGPDSGEASERGFTLSWRYDPSTQELEVHCTGKPFFVPCGTVNGRIDDAAAECGIAS
jgi:hypothetical protein